MRENLVVVRCGRASTHPGWTRGDAPRTFDLLLCPYEETPAGDDIPALRRTIAGQKWTGLAEFLTSERVWERYAYVWLPDDDLETDALTITRFFARCRALDASLAAPALAQGSKYSHVLMLENRAFRTRATTFVELMAPCFRKDVLEHLLPTFSATRTGHGWGLDDAWARLLLYRGLFVIDETPVRHDRPVGRHRSRKVVKAARAEMHAVHERFDACELRKTLGGVTAAGTPLSGRDPAFLDAYLSGYRALLDADPAIEPRLRRDQAKDPAAWLAGAGARARRGPGCPWWRRALSWRAPSKDRGA